MSTAGESVPAAAESLAVSGELGRRHVRSQHVAFAGRFAYLTSGYGSIIERVDAATGRVLNRAKAPYGSFELAADGADVVASSLLRGTVAIYDPQLVLRHVSSVAPAAREIALSSSSGWLNR